MRKPVKAAAASAVFVAVLSCGGSSSITNPGQSSSCTVTLSGGLTGTYDCKPASTVWSSNNNTGGFAFSVGTSGSTPYITVAIGFTGEPHTGSYHQTDAGATGGASVTSGSTQAWAATSGNTPTGSYSLNFSSVSNAITAGSGKAYAGEGTLDATLPALVGSSAAVTLHATF